MASRKEEVLFMASYGRGKENDDTIKRSIIGSIVRLRRKLDQRSRSECLDLRLCLERQ